MLRSRAKLLHSLYETATVKCTLILFFTVEEKSLEMQWLGSTDKKEGSIMERRKELKIY